MNHIFDVIFCRAVPDRASSYEFAMSHSFVKRFALCSLTAGLFALGGCSEVDAPAEELVTATATLGSRSADDRYIVTFRGSNGRAQVGAAGGRVAVDLPNQGAVAAYLPGAALDAILRNPNVLEIEPDARRYPSAETVPYGIPMVQADLVTVPDGTGRVPVCIIDSGIMGSHPDFAGLPVNGAVTNTAPWSTDHCGHGTHVAGTIAAVTGNDVGVSGVADDAVSLFIVKVFGDDCGWTYSSSLIAALDLCTTNGARVVSMSLGGSSKSRSEDRAFARAYADGVLSIAAAGNDGNTRSSYPASYDSVVSVAAVDSAGAHADFSQANSRVELSAPGVAVRSTYPVQTSLEIAGVSYEAGAIEFAAGSASGALVDGGRCLSAGSWAGSVVLCERGDISFFDKVANGEAGGAAAVILYNNEPGGFAGTLGEGNSSTIPAVSISQADGQALLAGALGLSASVASAVAGPGYAELDGTSMATPHVSGVAALIWSMAPSASNADIRDALAITALDLGDAGRDNLFGYGLIQAQAALDYLTTSVPEPDCSADSVCNAECAEGADPDCVTSGPDCSSDGVCNAECAAGDDADCSGPVCEETGSRCRSNAECCSGACVPVGRGNRAFCE